MSMLVSLAHQIREANRQVESLERELSEDPSDVVAQLELTSFNRHLEDLHSQYHELSIDKGAIVCGYKLSGDEVRAFGKVCRAVSEFQKLYTLVYSALRNGPRRQRRVFRDDERATSFGLAYTFTGSFGMTLTLPQERSLFEEEAAENEFDKSMDLVCQLASLTTPAEIRKFASSLGVGVVRELYAWVLAHVESKFSVDITWSHGNKICHSFYAQPQELSQLQLAIELTSETVEELPVTLTGKLIGADVKSQSFHFQADGGNEIKGVFDYEISDERPLNRLPLLCEIEVQKSLIVKYATDEEVVTYRLLSLREIRS